MSRDDEVGGVESSDDGTSDKERKKSENDEELQKFLPQLNYINTVLKALSTEMKTFKNENSYSKNNN